LQAFRDAGKWKEAVAYLNSVERKWSDDVNSWYSFCIGYADFLVDHDNPLESLEWIAKSSTVPSNLSNINLPVDYFYRQEEYYIEGLAYKKLGNKEKSQEFFRKTIDEQTDFLFNESAESRIQQLRFYAALAMSELGMENPARALLSGINEFRLRHGLVFLSLSKSEMKKWTTKDPLAEPVTVSSDH
jgi:tetratricopeptide (TPR) repeat protein